MQVLVSSIGDLGSLGDLGPHAKIFTGANILQEIAANDQILYIHSGGNSIMEKLETLMMAKREAKVAIINEPLRERVGAVGTLDAIRDLSQLAVDVSIEYLARLSPLSSTHHLMSETIVGYLSRVGRDIVRKFAKALAVKYNETITGAFGRFYQDDTGYFLIFDDEIRRVTNFKIDSISTVVYANGIDSVGVFMLGTDKFGKLIIDENITTYGMRLKYLGMHLSSVGDLVDVCQYVDAKRKKLVHAGIHDGKLYFPGESTPDYDIPGIYGLRISKKRISTADLRELSGSEVVEVAEKILDIMLGRKLWFLWCRDGDAMCVVKKAAEILGYEELVGSHRSLSMLRSKSGFRISNFFPQFLVVNSLDVNVIATAVAGFSGSMAVESPIVVIFKSRTTSYKDSYKVRKQAVFPRNYQFLSGIIYEEIGRSLPGKSITIKEILKKHEPNCKGPQRRRYKRRRS